MSRTYLTLAALLVIGVASLFAPILVLSILVLIYLAHTYKTKREHYKITSFVPTVSEKYVDNRDMSYQDKQAYMLTDKWLTLKKKVLERDSYMCRTCGSTTDLHMHHITYERLGDESLEDLVTLCGSCHQELHDDLGYSQYRVFNIKD